jgi:ABC-type sugar transport system ATPase subunit
MSDVGPPLVELRDIVKRFGSVIALNGVTMKVHAGEVMCLLGDNGAGKSTLIKTLSGVHQPTEGQILIDGEPVAMNSPRDALDRGIATVYQDLAMIPLMSITRNFFMGRELGRGRSALGRFDIAGANRVAKEEMSKIGIDVRDPTQAVGTLSGGERQCVAIARAVYFGARVYTSITLENRSASKSYRCSRMSSLETTSPARMTMNSSRRYSIAGRTCSWSACRTTRRRGSISSPPAQTVGAGRS